MLLRTGILQKTVVACVPVFRDSFSFSGRICNNNNNNNNNNNFFYIIINSLKKKEKTIHSKTLFTIPVDLKLYNNNNNNNNNFF